MDVQVFFLNMVFLSTDHNGSLLCTPVFRQKNKKSSLPFFEDRVKNMPPAQDSGNVKPKRSNCGKC